IHLVNLAATATTRADYLAAIDQLMRMWGNDGAYLSASDEALDNGYGLTLREPQDDQERAWMDIAIKAGEEEREAFRATLSEQEMEEVDAMRERMVGGLEKLSAYEAFTAHTLLTWDRVSSDAVNWTRMGTPPTGIAVPTSVPFSTYIAENRIAQPSSQVGYVRIDLPDLSSVTPIDSLWDRLVSDAAENLMPSL